MVRTHGERSSKRHYSKRKEKEVLDKLNQLQLAQSSPESQDICSTPPPKMPFSSIGHSSSIVRGSVPTAKSVLIHLPPPPPPSKREERKKKKRPAILPQHRRAELLRGRQQAASQSQMSMDKENVPPQGLTNNETQNFKPPTSPLFLAPSISNLPSNSSAPTPHPTPVSLPSFQTPIISPTPASFPTSHLPPITPVSPLGTAPPPTPSNIDSNLTSPVFYDFPTSHLTHPETPLGVFPSAPKPTPMSDPDSISPSIPSLHSKKSSFEPSSPSIALCSPLRVMGLSNDMPCGLPQTLKFETRNKSKISPKEIDGDEFSISGFS